MLLELEVEEPKRGRLKLSKIGPDGARYRKHFLDLDGPRHPRARLRRRGAPDPRRADHGPRRPGRALPLAGRARRERRRPWCRRTSSSASCKLPYGRGVDHAEGLCCLPTAGAAAVAPKELLVVYDSPAEGSAARRRPRSMPTSSGSPVAAAPGSSKGRSRRRRSARVPAMAAAAPAARLSRGRPRGGPRDLRREVLEGTASFELEPPDLADADRALAGDPRARACLTWSPSIDGRIAGYAYAGPYRAGPGYRYTGRGFGLRRAAGRAARASGGCCWTG